MWEGWGYVFFRGRDALKVDGCEKWDKCGKCGRKLRGCFLNAREREW